MSEKTKKATRRRIAKKQAAPEGTQATPDAQAAPEGAQATPDTQTAPESAQATPDTQAAPEGTQAQAAAEDWIVARVLKATKPLMKGDDVAALQAALIANNYHCGEDSKNGIFGRHTAYAVRCFQAHKGLIVDGKAGRYTVTALGGTWED